jgi:hypothetical protein
MRGAAVCIGVILSIPLFILPASAQPSARAEGDLERRMRDMRAQEATLREATRKPRVVPPEPRLSEQERDRVLQLRRVSPLDIGKYELFLKGEKTGIVKLFPDLGCLSKNVISVAPECRRFVPMSSSFTFRTNSYSDPTYHDIHFAQDRIFSNSFFSQGIFTVIGEELIDGVGLSHPAIKYLTGVQSATDPAGAAEQAKDFQNGIDNGGFRYADHIVPQADTTYALRMIAYRLENTLRPMSDETSMTEMMFLSLAFDKRIDITVVFRILAKDELGGMTILWKEIDRKDAGKIKFGKNQALRDFRPDSK